MRKHGRVDSTQAEIVKALRDIGAKVAILSDVGDGVADLVCGFRGNMLWIECKSKGGRMTKSEQMFYNEWQEYMVVVYSAEEALEAIGGLA